MVTFVSKRRMPLEMKLFRSFLDVIVVEFELGPLQVHRPRRRSARSS